MLLGTDAAVRVVANLGFRPLFRRVAETSLPSVDEPARNEGTLVLTTPWGV